jgi:serine/threonine protein kinase/tetratricopeptide (TPR) repeat protein
MSNGQRELLERLFHEARELNAEEQSRFLDEKCGADAAARRVVETLLREDARADGPLDGTMTGSLGTALSPGTLVGPYEVLSVAGIGGMGQVYRAVDRRLKRDVAIKVLPVEFAHDRERMERLRGEATVLASLNDPHVAAIYDVIETKDERPCLVLEFVPGATLAELLRDGQVDIDRTLSIAHQIAIALEAAHEKGIVHRDLKPSNIKLTPDAKVKVLDFGLARACAEGRAPSDPSSRAAFGVGASGLAGTPSYMSPEQARGLPVDQRADVWSFGCIVYELLTGRKAFEPTLKDTSSLNVQGRPDWASLPAGTPSELRRLLRHCLQDDRGKRPSDGSSLRRTIEELQKQHHEPLPQSLLARASGAAGTSPRAWRRVWKGAAVLVFLAISAGMVRWSSPRVDAPRLPPEAIRFREGLLQALAVDPRDAEARASYGFTFVLEVDQGYSNDRDLLYQAERELQQALIDAPKSANAHAFLAFVYYYQGRKDRMREAAGRSLELDPGNRDARMMMVLYHELNSDYETARAIVGQVIESGSSEPSPGVVVAARLHSAGILRERGDLKGAIRELLELGQQEPRNVGLKVMLAQAYQTDGQLSESRRLLGEAAPTERNNYNFRLVWALQLALEGRRDQALREMDATLRQYAEFTYFSLFAAEFYAVLGETDEALNWLDREIRAGDERVEWFERDPLLARIRDDPRFKQRMETLRSRRAQTSPGAAALAIRSPVEPLAK